MATAPTLQKVYPNGRNKKCAKSVERIESKCKRVAYNEGKKWKWNIHTHKHEQNLSLSQPNEYEEWNDAKEEKKEQVIIIKSRKSQSVKWGKMSTLVNGKTM